MNYIKLLGVFTLILYFEYLTYYIILNYNNKEINDKKVWIPPMMGLLNNVVFTVNHLVTLYFYTFNHCFCECLLIIKVLITRYFYLLEILIMCFLHFPTNIISIGGMGVALYFINQILKTILKELKSKND